MAASGGSRPSSTPKEVQVIQSILKDMGVTDYEPAVVNQLLDFTYRYTTEILEDARAFSQHAGKKSIDVDDTKLAVQLKLDKSYTNPPPRELLLDVAAHKNGQSLPLIKPYTGPKLPADRYCLSAMNYQLRTNRKPQLAYTVHSVGGIRQRGGSMLSPTAAIVNRVGTAGTTIRTVRPAIKPQATTNALYTQQISSSGGVISSASHTSQALASALGSSSSGDLTASGIKRKLEPDDDYDA